MLKKKFFKTKNDCEVTFDLEAGEAKSVSLVCEANGWKPIEMKKTKGSFRTRIRVPRKGRYQFRYLLDSGSWLNDDEADAYCRNEFGDKNSVLDTTPPSS